MVSCIDDFASRTGGMSQPSLQTVSKKLCQIEFRSDDITPYHSRHNVFSLKSCPGLIFKRLAGERYEEVKTNEKMVKYHKIIQRTEQITSKMGRLVVPQTQLMTLDGRTFLVQEKLEISNSDAIEEKRYGEKGHKKAIAQLTEFICRTGFFDVDYRNIPMLGDGRIALIDLEPEMMGNAGIGLIGLMKCVGKMHKLTVIWAAIKALWCRPWKWVALFNLLTEGLAAHNKVQKEQKEVDKFLKNKPVVEIDNLNFTEFGAESSKMKGLARKVMTYVQEMSKDEVRGKWLDYKARKFLFWCKKSSDTFFQFRKEIPKILPFLARNGLVFKPKDGYYGFWQAYS